MCRGERLIKLGDSWFSAKSIDVKPSLFFCGVKLSMGAGVIFIYQTQGNFEYTKAIFEESVRGCEGPRTRGKQPRPCAKVFKF